jgi:hypothetical protein
MLLVPLLYLLIGLWYVSRRTRDERTGVIDAAIMIVFWPMHVVASDPAATGRRRRDDARAPRRVDRLRRAG